MLNKIEQVNRQSAATQVRMLDDLLNGAKQKPVELLKEKTIKNIEMQKEKVKPLESIKGGFKSLLQQKNKDEQQKDLRKAAEGLESLFLSMLFKQMRSSVQKNKLTAGGGREEEIFTSMFDDEIAKNISSSKGIGFADAIMRQLSKKAI